MTEKFHEQGETPEEQKMRGHAMCDDFERAHPEVEMTLEERRPCGAEVLELEGIITSFESMYSLEDLHAIQVLTVEEAPIHPLRAPANKALNPITALLKVLKKETDISDEQHAALFQEYKRLSRAVGIINNDKVDHTR
jgi:hypothetical protein